MRILFILLFAAVACQSCKRCYNCTTTLTTSGPYGGVSTSNSRVCDMTVKDKENYEKSGTTTTQATSGTVTITQNTVTRCQ